MANGHGGRRPGSGRKRDDDATRLRRAARELCAARLEEMGRLALSAENERTRTAAFDRLFKLAYGRDLREAIPEESDADANVSEPIELVCATDPARAIPDPARR